MNYDREIFLGYILEHYDRNIYREVFDDDGHYMKMVDGEHKCEVEKDESLE